MEEIPPAYGAMGADFGILVGKTRVAELAKVGIFQVQKDALPFFAHTVSGEPGGNIFTYLVATGPRGRTHP